MDRSLRERQFVERVALAMEGFGLPLIAGRLLGWLLICEPAEQSSGQLATELGASKGSISTNTRMLMQMDLVEKVAVPGARSTYFRVRSGAWEEIMEQQLRQLTTFRVLLDDGVQMLGEASAERRCRLEDTRDFYAFMERELPQMLQHWRDRNV